MPGSLLHKHRSNIHVVSDVVTNTISSSAVRQELQQVGLDVLTGPGSRGLLLALLTAVHRLMSARAHLSTMMCMQGRSVQYLIPEEVRRYIGAHSLYSCRSKGS